MGSEYLVGLFVLCAGCDSAASLAAEAPQLDEPGATDAAPPAFVPLHLTAAELAIGARAPDLVLGNPSVIDTAALTVDGASNPFLTLQGGTAVLFAKNLIVENGLAIQGTLPLIIVANQRVTMTGAVELAAHGVAPGPGASPPTAIGAGGPGGATPLDPGFATAGGGGGGYATAGGPGGSQSPDRTAPGPAGQIFGGAPADPLIGGGPGGAGGRASGGGGGGGGALQISAQISISITGGHLSANGGGGAGGASGFPGGGGGGAGGEILLEAPSISVAATVVANGGGGGAGGGDGPVPFPAPLNGSDGALSGQPAPGGTGTLHGSDGGSGAAMHLTQLLAAQPGAGLQKDGGGGGGGLGRIWLRHRASTPPVIAATAVFSPAPVMDPTLPAAAR